MTDQPFMDYLTQINSPEGLFLWMCILVSFLAGFIIAYLLRTGKVRRLKRELRETKSEAEANHTLLTSAQEQLKQRNVELQEESREKVALMERLREAEDQRQTQLREVVILNERLEEMQAAGRNYDQTIEELNGRILTLQNQTGDTSDQPSTVVVTGDEATVEEISSLRERLNSFEQSLERLEQENDTLKTDLATLKDQPSGSTIVLNDGADDSEMDPEPEEPTLVMHMDKTALYDKIIVADRDKDDLTMIDGLGDFLKMKLYGLGIFRFDQIASWTPADIDRITQEIGYIPGRIEKDNWVGQAAVLLQAEQDKVATSEYDAREVDIADADEAPTQDAYERAEMDPGTDYVAEVDAADSVAPASDASPRKGYKPDNLRMVEGIGPKIEQVLKDAGISDLATLGSANPGRLREILEEAGDQYRMHNPYTWPLQARLAAAGRWEEFDQYQEELKGGR